MRDSGPALAVDRVLKGRRLLLSVAFAWSLTVVGMALQPIPFINYWGLGILAASPVLWLFPLWLLPKAPGLARYAAPLLLLAAPVVLVSSAFTMTYALGSALHYRDRVDHPRQHYSPGEGLRIRLDEGRSHTEMAVFDQSLRISAGGGALAALLEILGLYCWTGRMPAQRWSIALLLSLFGPAVAGVLYFFMG